MIDKQNGYKITKKSIFNFGGKDYSIKRINKSLFKEVLKMEEEIWLEDHDEDLEDEMNLKFFPSYVIMNKEYIMGYILFNKRYYNGKLAIDIEDFVVINMRKSIKFIKEIIELATKELLSRKDIHYILVNPNNYSKNFIKRIDKILKENESNIEIIYRNYGGYEPYGYENLKNN